MSSGSSQDPGAVPTSHSQLNLGGQNNIVGVGSISGSNNIVHVSIHVNQASSRSVLRPGGEIPDFSGERQRHERFCGRQDVLARLDKWLLDNDCLGGYVLVQGGPGRGKSALLSQWLGPLQTPRWPHHFIRRGVEGWDEPWRIITSLATQVEARFPELHASDTGPETRLSALLLRVSEQVLRPRGERLILVIDGLDEAQGDGERNPLPHFLPQSLPAGVFVLCASRPQYPYLSWLLDKCQERILDLDSAEWSGSNNATCRALWQTLPKAASLQLEPALIAAAVERSEGNLLYSVKLLEWLSSQPASAHSVQTVQNLPRGLRAFLDQSWARLRDELPKARWERVKTGLGLLCAAREALSLEALSRAAGWEDSDHGDDFLRDVRPFLLEQPAHWKDQPAYRPYHESFREFLVDKLGGATLRRHHQMLVERLCIWPFPDNADSFLRRYTLRHGVTQRIEARDWEGTDRLCRDLRFWQARIEIGCVRDVESNLEWAIEQDHEHNHYPSWTILQRGLAAISHHIRQDPTVLPTLMYNFLRCSGWEDTKIRRTLKLSRNGPLRVLLRHPLQRASHACLRTYADHRQDANACAYSPDGRRILSASFDNTLKVWDADSGELLRTLEGHRNSVSACAFSPDGRHILSASWDYTLMLWDTDSGQLLATLAASTDYVTACAYSPDGRIILSASRDGSLKLWDAESREVLHILTRHTLPVTACAFSPDSRRVVSTSDDATLNLWDADSGNLLRTLTGHTGAVTSCAFSPDNRHVVSASTDGDLKLWDADKGRLLRTLAGHTREVSACTYSPDGRRILSASRDCTLKLWDTDSGQLLRTLVGHAGWVTACAFSPNGRHVLSASRDCTLKLWNTSSEADLPITVAGHREQVVACAFSPDGRRIVSASHDHTIKLWDADSGQLLRTLLVQTGPVLTCAYSPDGRHILSASRDCTLKLWDASRRQLLRTMAGHSDVVIACAFSPDGQRILSGSSCGDCTLKLWDTSSGEALRTMAGHREGVSDCAFSPDGRRILSASFDQSLKLWDANSGQLLHTLWGHENSATACAFSPDGRYILSASLDQTLMLRDANSGEMLFTLTGHAKSVNDCAFSPDGRYILSASDDCSLKLWDAATRVCLDTVYGDAAFSRVSMNENGIVAGDSRGNVWFLELGRADPTSLEVRE